MSDKTGRDEVVVGGLYAIGYAILAALLIVGALICWDRWKTGRNFSGVCECPPAIESCGCSKPEACDCGTEIQQLQVAVLDLERSVAAHLDNRDQSIKRLEVAIADLDRRLAPLEAEICGKPKPPPIVRPASNVWPGWPLCPPPRAK